MYSRILVPVDGSVTSFKGLDEAIRLAKASGAQLKLVHVVNELIMDNGFVAGQYYDQLVAALSEVGKNVVSDAEDAVRRQSLSAQTELIETIGGSAADAIVEAARQWPADLIVMGTHGRRGLRRLALGSDAELVLRRSTVPVLMVRAAPEP
jgi:nucleotide-binding universal stress UspA family protein